MGGALAHQALDRWEGRRVEEWAREWAVPLVEAHEELSSTNDRLRSLADAGADSFTVVTADSQTQGRGRGGKRWQSPRGMGLWMSFLLRGGSQTPPTLVPILVGLAAIRALDRLCPSLRPGIKWPNDIEVEGRKLGGILCESTRTGAVIVGIGINLRQGIEDFDPGLKERAASLAMAGCRDASRSAIVTELLRASRSLLDPPARSLDERLRQVVWDRDILKGRFVTAEVAISGEVVPIVGKPVGIGADGALLVDVEGRIREVRTGSVTVVDGRPTEPTMNRPGGA
jgi:BirA family biotin operon repressor/biotin-[acetyl-CoA-carboxylase] ligase